MCPLWQSKKSNPIINLLPLQYGEEQKKKKSNQQQTQTTKTFLPSWDSDLFSFHMKEAKYTIAWTTPNKMDDKSTLTKIDEGR